MQHHHPLAGFNKIRIVELRAQAASGSVVKKLGSDKVLFEYESPVSGTASPQQMQPFLFQKGPAMRLFIDLTSTLMSLEFT